MGAALELTVTLTRIDCGRCGGTYAINETYRANQQVVGGSWTCPYCKVGWGFANNNDNARLRKQLAEETERKNRALAEANSLRIREGKARAEAARLKKRVKNGVCPCCTRSFTNLQRHIKTKHPDFAQS